MSAWEVPCGNVVAGAISQEEELFRRSNYYKTLKESFYPLKIRTLNCCFLKNKNT